ncbi:MAG: hypothetical protein JO176_08625 [Acidimicrobiia bacterium]|nr:hypothetical protein [Acidimicrobiia bacterium]
MTRTVKLVGVPVDLYLDAQRHMLEIVREFALISFGDKSGATEPVPERLLDLVDQLRKRYAPSTDAIRAQIDEAAAAGRKTVDVELPADERAAAITEDITDLLDAADDYCRSGDLLTLASSPEMVAWRHWWRDEVVAQVRADAEPRPWMPASTR